MMCRVGNTGKNKLKLLSDHYGIAKFFGFLGAQNEHGVAPGFATTDLAGLSSNFTRNRSSLTGCLDHLFRHFIVINQVEMP
ncbi:MAG: hypothetical protein QG672_1937 [Pseudomonadota bacterium]|jgi:hypothetical protein|nr:hypothetical protein [Pseudomonadota bacterium]